MAFSNTNKKETFTFESLPKNLQELQALPEAALSTPFMTAALTIAVLARYNENQEDALQMYDWINGPADVTPYDKQFIKEHLGGRQYLINSYFEGTSPENGYTPSNPFTIVIFDNPYSYQEEGRATLWVQSTGADSPRQMSFRLKPSTGQWFLTQQMLLAGIRTPAAEDPWA